MNIITAIEVIGLSKGLKGRVHLLVGTGHKLRIQ